MPCALLQEWSRAKGDGFCSYWRFYFNCVATSIWLLLMFSILNLLQKVTLSHTSTKQCRQKAVFLSVHQTLPFPTLIFASTSSTSTTSPVDSATPATKSMTGSSYTQMGWKIICFKFEAHLNCWSSYNPFSVWHRKRVGKELVWKQYGLSLKTPYQNKSTHVKYVSTEKIVLALQFLISLSIINNHVNTQWFTFYIFNLRMKIYKLYWTSYTATWAANKRVLTAI